MVKAKFSPGGLRPPDPPLPSLLFRHVFWHGTDANDAFRTLFAKDGRASSKQILLQEAPWAHVTPRCGINTLPWALGTRRWGMVSLQSFLTRRFHVCLRTFVAVVLLLVVLLLVGQPLYELWCLLCALLFDCWAAFV